MFGLFIRRHAEAMAEANKISVICFETIPGKDRVRRICISEENNVWVARVQVTKTNGLWGKMLQIVNFFTGMHRAFAILRKARGKPDFSMVHVLTRMGIVALIIKKLYGIPYVVVEHWSRYLSFPGTYKGKLRKWLTQLVVKNSSGLASVSQFLLDAMETHGLSHRNRAVIGNVVDCEIFKPVNLSSFSYGLKIPFVSITCFEDKSKNLTGLLNALKILKTFRNDFICIMAGTGQDINSIKELSSRLQLDDCILFTGLVEGKNVADQINDSAFLVISSRYENLPVVINEAFCCGKPVVSTLVGGIHEIISPERGIMVEAENDHALSEAISYMLDHYQQYDAKKIRSFALKRFSPEAVRQQFETFTQNITSDDH